MIYDSDTEMTAILCSQIGRFNILKMSILSKLTYTFNTIAIKIPADFFVDKILYNLYGKTNELEELTQFCKKRIKQEESIIDIA